MQRRPSDESEDYHLLEQTITQLTVELRRKNEEQRAICQIHRAVSAHLDNDELFEAIARAARTVVPFCCMAVVLPGLTHDKFLVYAVDINDDQPCCHAGLIIPAEGTVTASVFQHQRPFIAKRVEDLRPFPYCFKECANLGIESHCALPLLIRDQTVGVLIFAGRERHLYSETTLPFLEELATTVAIALDNRLAYQGRARLKRQLAVTKLEAEKVATREGFEGIVGKSRAIQEVVERIALVARTDSSVLISGETGTGKELVARAIFHLSRRKEKPLVIVNCAALPVSLIESELFGHEKGAFTGAVVRRVGRFELANGGTIFLDEIGDLPHDVQAKLLRVLQDHTFERVGGTRTVKVDVRVIAATNRQLTKAVESNGFRADLYYRLNVFPVHLPPLRERPEDIAPLAEYLLEKYARKLQKSVTIIDEETMQRLVAYSWPGNVRELENVIERAVIVSNGASLEVEDDLLPIPPTKDPPVLPLNGGRPEKIEPEEEIEILLNSLELAGGNHSKAARFLGIGRTTFWRKLKLHGLSGLFIPFISEDLLLLFSSAVQALPSAT